ncbi:MAG: hypothetical protein ACREQN_11915 [Candidatus Binataceae bacterium]
MRKLVVLVAVGFALVGALGLSACSEMQQPPMNQAQAATYNQCMSTHWSSLADSLLFGVAGYEYHQNAVLNCQQMALYQGSGHPASDGAVSEGTPVGAAAPEPTLTTKSN